MKTLNNAEFISIPLYIIAIATLVIMFNSFDAVNEMRAANKIAAQQCQGVNK